MFLKELFEDRNDDLTKDGYMSHLDKEQAKATRAKKDESKPSASSMLRNWIERNNASSESDQILYALVRHLEKLDPSITEKILSFIEGSEGMDETTADTGHGFKAKDYVEPTVKNAQGQTPKLNGSGSMSASGGADLGDGVSGSAGMSITVSGGHNTYPRKK